MVLLQTTPRILSAISSLSSTDISALTNDETSLPTTCEQPIEHKTLIALSRRLSKPQGQRSSTLDILLRGTHVYIPPAPPKPQPSAEYIALMDRLRKEQEQREYAGLVSKREAAGLTSDNEKDDISPSLVLNILLSIVLCAMAVFHLTRWWSNDGVRVLLSLATGIVVGVAEVVVYMAYLRKVAVSKQKERSKTERKTLIGEYRGEQMLTDAHGRAVSIDAATMMEKEEIWGRGINGGMRRRVREKWEKEQKNANRNGLSSSGISI
ncbi:hypothetical protein G647_04481 [Cladophialophora carrionii CBS 160.54]|uniref:Endoplasmic reticulum-based factor for assembly of V-ATPase n=1 Tax=Cladophialophora carrionii CBS 160.54 TaxID=1279043 RepID=V9DDX6_9EURO|nr:uncharacterized protein G647_04481 [Cladophialophora carrionii CBS 160.54]ETI25109.1 hypothetical protein G647_04481 [Cladophialophora carrionii CBS 160.54]